MQHPLVPRHPVHVRPDVISPSILFEGGEVGAWFEPLPTTTFTNTSRTTPASVGQDVASMTDLSGNENHATHATASAYPTLARVPGSGARNLVDAGRALAVDPTVTWTPNAQVVNGEPYSRITEAVGTLNNPRLSENFVVSAGDVLVIAVRVIGAGRHFAIRTSVGAATLNTTTGQVSATGGTGFIAAGVAPDGRFWIKVQFSSAVTDNIQYRPLENPAVTFQIYTGDGVSGVFLGRISIEKQAAEAPHGPSTEQLRNSAFDITEAGQPDNWHLFDSGSDVIRWTAPNDTYSIAYVGSGGEAVLLEGQALSGATDLLQAVRTGPYIAANRVWTAAEKSNITRYLEKEGRGL